MSAVETFFAAQQAGLRLDLDGTDLLIESDQEPPAELLDALRRDKSAIIALLRKDEPVGVPMSSAADRPRADLHGLTLAELEDAAGDDWPTVRGDPATLECLAHAVITRRQRLRGECPPHWTARCVCTHCGPIFLWPDSPGQVSGCPWCFNRTANRPIPRPVSVSCASCFHFRPSGQPHRGECAIKALSMPPELWANVLRDCNRWIPLNNKSDGGDHGGQA